MKISFKGELENAVVNLDGTTTLYFKRSSTETQNAYKLTEDIKNLQDNAKNGLKIEVSVYREQRSINANAYFHLLVNEIARKMDISDTECKVKFNLEYGTPAVDKSGNKVVVKMPEEVDISQFYEYAKYIGQKTENGKKLNYYVFYKQTHLLDTKEMSQLINGVVESAKELGIETKTPKEIEDMLSLEKDYVSN